jgi:hypothetical protein
MKTVVAALFATCVMAPALAQPPPGLPPPPLDLKLRSQAYPPPSATAPGVYYGDVSGNRGDDGNGDDGSVPGFDTKTHVSGSVSTSIGYARGFGTGTSNGAQLHVNKRFEGGGGVDVHIGVQHTDGFNDRWPYRGRR